MQIFALTFILFLLKLSDGSGYLKVTYYQYQIKPSFVHLMFARFSSFKGIRNPKPWKVNRNVGPVVVLCGGKIRDNDENYLCTLDSEGKCTLYDVVRCREEVDDITGVPHSETLVSSNTCNPLQPGELRIAHCEMLASNARSAIMEDIDNDGVKELIVGYTDRFVRIYKWCDEGETPSCNASPTKKISISSVLKKESKENKEVVKTSYKRESYGLESEHRKAGLAFSMPSKTRESFASSLRSSKDMTDTYYTQPSQGFFVMVRQYSLFSQVGCMAVTKLDDGMRQLIISQPNGGYCIAEEFREDNCFAELLDREEKVDPGIIQIPELIHPFQPKHSRSLYTSTEVIGGVRREGVSGGVIGICSLDGNYMILEDTSLVTLQKKEWVPSEHRWFSMAKFDVTNDGDDEIILCSMNGMTYMIDKIGNIVSYNFNENVAAFCAGPYGPLEANNVSANCLCYVTLSGKIHVYYNVWISAMKVKCVHGAIIEKLKQSDDLKHILDGLKLPTGEIDHKKIQMLVKNTWSEKQK